MINYTFHIHVGASCFNLPWHKMQNAAEMNLDEKFLLVEANPEIAERLDVELAERGLTKYAHVVKAAISTFDGFIDLQAPDFSQIDTSHPENQWMLGISNVKNAANTGRDLLDQKFFHGKTVKYRVPCMTLNRLVEERMIVSNYCSSSIGSLIIDTEGHDFDILGMYNFRYKPAFIKAEYKHCTIPTEQIAELLRAHNYEVFVESEDIYAYL